tara:strand:+ start:50 stop:1099 length:1050 start_codon:yes stop_codon:yes gene_type:complete
MPISGALILGGAGIVGGMMSGNAARDAANASAQAQLESARIAADAAKFRPVGITTRYGQSNFQTDANGNLIGAGYNVSPELRGYQDTLSAMQGRQLGEAANAYQQYQPLQGAASGLFNLGQQYLAQSPEQAAQQYMANQQALLAPSREQQSANLMNQLQNTGRTGLSVAQGGGLMAANPEAAALANARAMQDLQLAANAQQAGQQQTAFGAGLFNQGAGLLGQYQAGQVGALSPFQTSLGTSSTIEQLGQSPLDIGAQLGGRSATAGANVGNYLMQGGTNAARTMQGANAFSPIGTALINASTNQQLQQGLGNWWNNQTQYTPQQFQQQQAATYGSANAGFGGTGGFFD